MMFKNVFNPDNDKKKKSSTARSPSEENLLPLFEWPLINQYTVTFSLHQGGVVMSNQITHTQSSNLNPLAHILDTCALNLV